MSDFKKLLVAFGVPASDLEAVGADLAEVKAETWMFLPNGNIEVNKAMMGAWKGWGLQFRVVPGVGLFLGPPAPKPVEKAVPAKTEAEALKAQLEAQAKIIADLHAKLNAPVEPSKPTTQRRRTTPAPPPSE